MEKNLTTGSVGRQLIGFSLPYLLSYLLQTLYGMADLFIIGQYEGVAGTTAVAVGSQVMHMLTVMIVGLAMGTTVSIARAIGADDRPQAAAATGNTVTLFLSLSLVLTAGLLLLRRPITAVGIVEKIIGFLFLVPSSMLSAVSALGAQNLGAGKPERVRTGVRDATILGIAYCILMFAVLYSCGGALTSLFLDPNDLTAMSEILPLSEQYLRVCATFYIPLLFVYLLRFTIQGLGYSSLAVVAGVFEMVARGTFALLLVPSLGFNAVCYASPTAWIMADVFLFPAYFHCLKKQGCSFRRAPHLAAVKVEG